METARAADPAPAVGKPKSHVIVIDAPTGDLQHPRTRVELPCINRRSPHICTTTGVVRTQMKLPGAEGKTHHYLLRIRGVVELNVYSGGKPLTRYCELGGTPGRPGWNIVEFSVSSSPKRYFINGGGIDPLGIIDYTTKIEARGGDTLTLQMTDADGLQVRNAFGVKVASMDAAVDGFDGQFVQVDLVKTLP